MNKDDAASTKSSIKSGITMHATFVTEEGKISMKDARE